MPENPMMMMVPGGGMAPQPEEPEVKAIPDAVLDKHQKIYLGFRESVAHMLRSVDGESWPEEADCIHLLMHIDSKMEMALDWIEDRRAATIDAKSTPGVDAPTPEGPGNGGTYI